MTSPPRRPAAFWPGLLLHLLLPGSGFTLLGRPWLHLLALTLTVLDWFAAWLLVLSVADSGLATDSGMPQPLATALVFLGGLMVLASYLLLAWTYVRVYRRSARRLPVALKWLLVLLHLGGLLGLVLPTLLDDPGLF